MYNNSRNNSLESKSKIDHKWDGKVRFKTKKTNFVGANIRNISRDNSQKALKNNSDLEFSMVYNDSRKSVEKRHENIVKSIRTGHY